MLDQQPEPGLNRASFGGVAGTHDAAGDEGFLVAPTVKDDYNRLRTALIPVACWRVDDMRFDFDSSFVRPEILIEIEHLESLVQTHPGCPLSVFGHADPVGGDEYNKVLSGRRAIAIYAILIARSSPAKAAGLWQRLASQENWGAPAYAAMRADTGLPAGSSHGALIQNYLEKLGGTKLKLSETDFLGHGQDAGGKADYQGCGEFNPLLIFSQEEASRFEQPRNHGERNAANAPNRRVMVMMFRKGSRVEPAKWPCPRASEGTAGCRKRFWSDGEARRSARLPDKRRKYDETHDTFACRFYQRLSATSPCEQATGIFRFGFDNRLCEKEPEKMRLLIEDEDGKAAKTFHIEEGVVKGTQRVFTFAKARAGVAYRVFLTYPGRKLLLIAKAVVSEIADPDSSERSVSHVHAKDMPQASEES